MIFCSVQNRVTTVLESLHSIGLAVGQADDDFVIRALRSQIAPPATKKGKEGRKAGSNQIKIVEYLKLYPDGKTQREISEATGVGRSSVHLTLKTKPDIFKTDENGTWFLK